MRMCEWIAHNVRIPPSYVKVLTNKNLRKKYIFAPFIPNSRRRKCLYESWIVVRSYQCLMSYLCIPYSCITITIFQVYI